MDVHTVSGCFILLTPLLSPTALSSLESSPAGSGFFRVFCWLALPTQFSFSCCIGGWLPTPAFHSFPFAFRLVKSASTGFVPCVYYIQWLCVSLFMFLLHCTACEILVPQPDMEPCPLQWKQSANHWVARELPSLTSVTGYWEICLIDENVGPEGSQNSLGLQLGVTALDCYLESHTQNIEC